MPGDGHGALRRDAGEEGEQEKWGWGEGEVKWEREELRIRIRYRGTVDIWLPRNFF